MRKNTKTHEQFLEDLRNKNIYYREGKFTISGNYIGCHNSILVTTEFGDCISSPSVLMQGSIPSIRTAVEKTEYFKNMCIDRFGEDGNDDLSEILYINNFTKVKIRCKVTNEYYYITPADYYMGHRSKKAGRNMSDKARRLDQDYVFKIIKELHPELKFLPNQVYKNNRSHLLLVDKYGVVSSIVNNLLKGQSPTIKSAVNKTEYFINKAKEVHGDKYDYSLVKYINHKTKVKIVGNFGVFEQTPHNHLIGHGCPTEGLNRGTEFQKINPRSWTYTNWQEAAKISQNFSGYKIYFLECYDNETKEKFFKIGRTFNSIHNRFKSKHAMPYSYKVLHIIESDNAREICELEWEYKNIHKEFKYLPNKKFGGMHECFSKLIIDKLKEDNEIQSRR